MTQRTAGGPMESAGDVLPRVPQLFGDRLDSHFLVGADAPPHALHECPDQAVHLRLLCVEQSTSRSRGATIVGRIGTMGGSYCQKQQVQGSALPASGVAFM